MTPLPRCILRAPGLLLAAVAAALLSLPAASPAADPVVEFLRVGSREAPGLGGDPFASPLEDGSGWWGSVRFREQPTLRMGLDARELLSQRLTRDQGALGGTELFCEGTMAGRLGRRPWLLVARSAWPHRTAGWAGAHGGLRLEGSPPVAGLALRTLDWGPHLDAQLTCVMDNRNGVAGIREQGAGLRARLGGRLRLQAGWERSRARDRLRSDLYQDPWSASINLRRSTVSGDGRLSLPFSLGLEGGASRTTLGGVEGRSSALDYQLFPAGSIQGGQICLTWRPPSGAGLLFRRTSWRGDLSGGADWGGERFGQVTYARADLESSLLGVEFRPSSRVRWILDGEVVRAGGRARAEIESWPFTSTVIDLLGLKRIYRSDFSLDWARVHLARECGHASGSLRGRCGLTWWDLHPRLALRSWRPAFLVFGVSDRREEDLAIRRAQLAALSLGCDFPAGPFQATLDFEQIVYAHCSRAAESTGGGSSSGEGEGPKGSNALSLTRRPGGSQASFSLRRSF